MTDPFTSLTLREENMVKAIVDQLEARLAFRLGNATAYDPVLSLAKAIEYTGAGSDSAFHRWTALRGVKPCGRGRYLKSELDRGLRVSQQLVEARRGARKRKASKSSRVPMTTRVDDAGPAGVGREACPSLEGAA